MLEAIYGVESGLKGNAEHVELRPLKRTVGKRYWIWRGRVRNEDVFMSGKNNLEKFYL